jgi:hypothetical protein
MESNCTRKIDVTDWTQAHKNGDTRSRLCFNTFIDSSPDYLSQLLTVYTPSRQLSSSSDTRILRIPRMKTKSFGQRSFSFTGPPQWNSLPYEIRHSDSAPAFKSALKTHLFKSAYNIWFNLLSSAQLLRFIHTRFLFRKLRIVCVFKWFEMCCAGACDSYLEFNDWLVVTLLTFVYNLWSASCPVRLMRYTNPLYYYY